MWVVHGAQKESDITDDFHSQWKPALGEQSCREVSPLFSLGRIQHTNGLMTYDC